MSPLNTPDGLVMRLRAIAGGKSDGDWSASVFRESADVITALRAENAALRVALEPFAHDDLCEQLGGNAEDNASPVYARNRAMLTLGNFRQARAALAKEGEA